MTLPTSEIRLRCLTSLVHDLGKYAFYQFAREVVAASSGVLDVLEIYAKLDPAITNAYGVEPPRLWPVK